MAYTLAMETAEPMCMNVERKNFVLVDNSNRDMVLK